MTTGEYLVAHSALASGTAKAHLLALQSGGGQAVFCSQIGVVFEQPELVITRRPKRQSEPVQTSPVQSPISDRQQKSMTAFRAEQCLTVIAEGPDEITVTQRLNSIVARQMANDKTITRRAKRV